MIDSGGVDEYLMIIGMSIDDCLTSWKSREIDDLDESWFLCPPVSLLRLSTVNFQNEI